MDFCCLVFGCFFISQLAGRNPRQRHKKKMAHAKVAEVALLAGVVGALISAALPSPTTIVKFKPWKDPDAAVRFTFWLSLGTAGALAIFLFVGMREGAFRE